MSKKDYQAIARAVFETWGLRPFADPHGVYKRDQFVARLADVLAADNPRFDRARFLEACETGTCKGMKKES